MRKATFNAAELMKCKCLLKDDDDGELELKLLNVDARYEGFGDEILVKLDCAYNLGVQTPKQKPKKPELTVRRVIFNPPATIVLWEDGTKTVVKCDPRDAYSPEYGYALCYMKKALGNTSRGLNDALHRLYEEMVKG